MAKRKAKDTALEKVSGGLPLRQKTDFLEDKMDELCMKTELLEQKLDLYLQREETMRQAERKLQRIRKLDKKNSVLAQKGKK